MEMKTVRKEMKVDIDYKVAVNRLKITPTLRIDYQTLKALGIAEDVLWYLDALKLQTFMEIEHPSYSFLAREFLSTFTFAYPRCKRHLTKNEVFSFKNMDEEYSFTIAQISDFLGFQ